jgi:hypothetical protein
MWPPSYVCWFIKPIYEYTEYYLVISCYLCITNHGDIGATCGSRSERCRIGLFGLRQTHWQVQASWKGLQVRLQGVCQWVANSLDLEISKPGMKDCCKHHRGRDLAITISYKSL